MNKTRTAELVSNITGDDKDVIVCNVRFSLLQPGEQRTYETIPCPILDYNETYATVCEPTTVDRFCHIMRLNQAVRNGFPRAGYVLACDVTNKRMYVNVPRKTFSDELNALLV